jgi:hypothetical protein
MEQRLSFGSRRSSGLLCLSGLLSIPCWSAAAAPTPSALPCTGSSASVARDIHVFFPDEKQMGPSGPLF